MASTPKKTHKTIFGTTEKSNFILNMTNNGFNKFAAIAFSAGFLLIFILSAVTEFFSLRELTEKNYDWRIIPSIALGITGIAGISIFIIALIKQTLDKKQIAAAVIALIMTVFMYISYINAYALVKDYSAFLGYRNGRYEGFLVHLCYLFIFLGSLTINKENTVKKIFSVFLIIMLLESVWSALQFIPSFPDHYSSIPYLIKNQLLPSGTTGSPAFLATLFSIGLLIAVFGAFYEKTKLLSVLCKLSIVPLSFILFKTQTLIGVFSSALTIVLAVFLFARNKKQDKLSSTPLVLLLTGTIASLAFVFIRGFALLDGPIIWHDGCKRLAAFGQYTAKLDNSFDIHSIKESYAFMWNKAIEFIGKFPITGLGPDAFAIPQLDTVKPDFKLAMTIDRPYNEYLFYAATLGIPSALAFASILIYSAVNGAKAFKKNKSWISLAAVSISIMYIITAAVTNSTATVTPFVWFILGTCCCSFIEKE